MLIEICGSRGSLPSPGADKLRYGGNTSCVHVTLSDGTHLILDAGTGIRNLPAEIGTTGGHVHILLTHLHLDHIQGLLFFSPLFESECQVTIWGPAAPGVSLKSRITRYLSAPLTPVDVRELPCQLDFRNCPVAEWEIGPARMRAEAVTHRGPTLGFRIEDQGESLCYLPDHEPALIGPLEDLAPQWISGYSLARGADLLIHDGQYTDGEYPDHFGWGHSAISHTIHFADRCQPRRTLFFHHDPYHADDQLDAMYEDALRGWQQLGGAADAIAMASEGDVLSTGAPVGAAHALATHRNGAS
ncbi:MAG: MBL fold metallo-hydrolase [Actinomycetota bacterium]|nr:MBL fold metallo-hydrolase [Actinomycetota bacterium]